MSNKMKICVAVLLCVCLLSAGIIGSFAEKKNADALTLKYGSKGEEVKKLQTALKEQGFYFGKIDGIYGNGTYNAVKKMQKAYGLYCDGIAGAKTLSALRITTQQGSSSGQNTTGGAGSYTSSEVYLLAKCIYAEARGESYTGKVAVGAVILNRVKSSKFPNTISGVIYQPGAFTAVSDGQINLSPNDECMRAAKDAINGWDPTYGCIYYYNPAKATSQWIWSTQTVTTIGSHVFSI